MEDLFGGECNMFNPAATKDSDEEGKTCGEIEIAAYMRWELGR